MTDIRPLLEEDLPHLLEMAQALAAHHGDAATVTLEELRRDMLGAHPWVRVLVAPGKGYAALCPMVQVQFGVRGMDMHHLYVVPQARGQGVGRALVSASLALAKAQGCRFLMVGTHPDNSVAQQAYLKMGFDALTGAGPRFRMKW